jgi:hypothetical protein
VGANLSRFNVIVLLVVGDVPVDIETPVVTSSILRIRFENTHRDKVCVHVFIKKTNDLHLHEHKVSDGLLFTL